MTRSFNDFFTTFVDLADPHLARTRRHELLKIVIVAVCATVAGSDRWTDIERFDCERLDWLRTFLRLENGIPSHETLWACLLAAQSWTYPRNVGVRKSEYA
jgi:hypothetical protein